MNRTKRNLMAAVAALGWVIAVILMAWSSAREPAGNASSAAPPSREPRSAPSRARSPDPDPTTDEKPDLREILKRVIASADARITGSVLTKDGKPTGLANIELSFDAAGPADATYQYHVVAAADGTFEVPVIRYPLRYAVHVVSPGGEIDSSELVMIERDRQELRILVELGLIVSGRITATSGGPVPSASVTVIGKELQGDDGVGERFRTVSAANGEYRCRVPLACGSAPLTVVASARGYQPALMETAPSSPLAARADVALSPSITVSGTVVDEQGAPIPGVEVTLSSLIYMPNGRQRMDPRILASLDISTYGAWGQNGGDGKFDMVTHRVVTDASGEFGLTPITPAQRITLTACIGDAEPFIREIGSSDGADVAPIAIRLNRTSPARRFRILDDEDKPLVGVRVTFQSRAVNQLQQLNSPTIVTNDDGECETRFTTPGESYTAYVRSSTVHKNVTVVVAPEGQVTVISIEK